MWWENYQAHLPDLTDDDKKRIEDITGGIPLLLRALLSPDFKKLKFEKLLAEYLNTQELLQVTDQMEAFALQTKSTLTEVQWNQ